MANPFAKTRLHLLFSVTSVLQNLLEFLLTIHYVTSACQNSIEIVSRPHSASHPPAKILYKVSLRPHCSTFVPTASLFSEKNHIHFVSPDAALYPLAKTLFKLPLTSHCVTPTWRNSSETISQFPLRHIHLSKPFLKLALIPTALHSRVKTFLKLPLIPQCVTSLAKVHLKLPYTSRCVTSAYLNLTRTAFSLRCVISGGWVVRKTSIHKLFGPSLARGPADLAVTLPT